LNCTLKAIKKLGLGKFKMSRHSGRKRGSKIGQNCNVLFEFMRFAQKITYKIRNSAYLSYKIQIAVNIKEKSYLKLLKKYLSFE